MEWVRGKTIGNGSFASVSLAKTVSHSSRFPHLIAVKSCAVSHCDSLKNECMILEELKGCQEIINCYGDSISLEKGQKLYNIALEYASGGALSNKVKNFGLSESEIREYTKSILKGIQFIHGNGFVHCDIKLDNVLLVQGNGKESVKIADFGLAKRSGEMKSKYEIRGSPMYLAPETVVGGVQESASDIWALGCLVTEMISGNPVWNCSDIGALLMKIGVGSEIPEIPAKLSDIGKDFISKCLLKDPSSRWTAEMLLSHPFISSGTFEKEVQNQISPRDPFDFPDWESENSGLFTPESLPEFDFPVIAPAKRLGQLLTEQKPNWSVTNSWVKVR